MQTHRISTTIKTCPVSRRNAAIIRSSACSLSSAQRNGKNPSTKRLHKYTYNFSYKRAIVVHHDPTNSNRTRTAVVNFSSTHSTSVIQKVQKTPDKYPCLYLVIYLGGLEQLNPPNRKVSHSPWVAGGPVISHDGET